MVSRARDWLRGHIRQLIAYTALIMGAYLTILGAYLTIRALVRLS